MVTRRTFLGGAGALAGGLATRGVASATFGDTPLAGTISVAVVAPFTGDSIRYGEQIGNGVRAAFDDANLLRGALDRAFAMHTYDDQNLLAEGLVNAQFACDDPTIVAVIGHLSGRITEAAMRTYQGAQMQVICPASSYDRLTAHGYGNLLRLVTKDSSEGILAARHINTTLKPKAAVALYQDGDYGADVVAGFVAEMQGDKVTTTPLSFSWQKPDFAAAAKSALAAKPDVVFLSGQAADMGPILPALAAAGYSGPIYASQGFFDPATITKFGKLAEGLTISSSMPPLAIAPGAFRIKNDFERKYGAMTPLSAFAYAAAQIIVAVVRRTNAIDRIAISRALNVTTPFNTVVGAIAFANDGDPVEPNVYFYAVKDGAWRYVSSAIPSSYIVR
jgi:branched-chain amino acid transport system substrate-binding protein